MKTNASKIKSLVVIIIALLTLAGSGCLIAGCTSLTTQTDIPIVHPALNNTPTIPPTTAPDTTQIILPATSVVPVEPAQEGITVCIKVLVYPSSGGTTIGLKCIFVPETTSDQYKSTHPEAKEEIVIDGDHAKNNYQGIMLIYSWQQSKKVTIDHCEHGIGTVVDCARCGVTLDRDNGNVIKINLSDRSYWCGYDY